MKNFTLKTLLMSALLCVGLSARGEDKVFYTLDPVAGSNNGYTSNCDVTIGGITWNISGNSQMVPWRIGGKSLEEIDRTVYSKTTMGEAITKVELEVGAANSITVNSLKLIIASDANFSNVIDQVSASFVASSTITFTPTSPLTKWSKNAFYKFVFNVTVSSTSNKFVEFTKAKFYYNGKQNPGLSFGDYDKQEIPIFYDDDFTPPALTKPEGVTVTYTSSDESIATVNPTTGAVTVLVNMGITTITATSDETDTYEAGSTYYDLNVDFHPLTTAKYKDENPEIYVGDKYTNIITTNPEVPVTYTNSAPTIASVDENTGEVTGLAEGTALITATWDYQEIDGVWYRNDAIDYILKVKKHDSDIAFASDSYTVDLADVASFTAPTANYSGDGTVTYTSSNTSVATVNETTGALTLLKKGTTVIKATSAVTNAYLGGTAEYTLTVVDPNSVETTMTTKIDFSTLGLVNGEQYTTHTYGGVTVTFGSGDNDGKYYNIGTGIRTYANGTINVTAGGNTITKIVMVFNSGYAPTKDNVTSWSSGSATYDSNTTTWTGSAESVTVTRHSASGNWRLQTITISYTTSEYTRTVTTGNYGTLCVPFGVDANGITGATFYTISGKTVSGNVVTSVDLEPVTTLTAGVGYIFKATANEIKLTPNNTTVEDPVQDGAIVGTFTSATPVANGMYILSNNQLCQTAENFGFIVANRAYIDLTDVPVSNSAAKARISVEGADDATAITAIEAADAIKDGVIYNLNGQRVVKPLKGIYIQNGKKILVK